MRTRPSRAVRDQVDAREREAVSAATSLDGLGFPQAGLDVPSVICGTVFHHLVDRPKFG